MSDPLVYDELSAADTFTKELSITDFDFALAIWGTFTGTLTLQIKPAWRDVTADWINVSDYGTPIVVMSTVVKGACLVRIGFLSGSYTSGTANVALYRGEDSTARAVVTKRLV